MNWIALTEAGQLEAIVEQSTQRPQVIFKHSTRCSISAVVKNRLEKSVAIPTADFYFLDLIQYRSLSDAIAQRFDVYHESPQVLVIRNGACVFDESHSAITMDEITEQATAGMQ